MLAWNLRRATPSSPPPGKWQAQGPTSPPTAHSETEACTIPTLGIAATDTHACNRDIFPFLLETVKQSLFAGLFHDFQKKGKMGVWSGVGFPSFWCLDAWRFLRTENAWGFALRKKDRRSWGILRIFIFGKNAVFPCFFPVVRFLVKKRIDTIRDFAFNTSY